MWVSLDSASINSYPRISRPLLMAEALRGGLRWTYSGSALMVWEPDVVEFQGRRAVAKQAKQVIDAT